MNKRLLSLAIVLAVNQACAQLVLSTMHSAAIIDFDSTVSGVSNGTFAGAGFQPSPTAGQLDSDAWAVTGLSDGTLGFGGTQTSTGDFARGTTAAAVTTGGIYGYSVTTTPLNRGLGIQPGGTDFIAPGTLTLRLRNTTGQTVIGLSVSYTVWVRNDQGRANSFNFSHSSNDSTYTAVPALNLTSPVAADALGLVSNSRSTTIATSIANNAFYYLRWSGADVSGSGSRDEFVLDDISVTPVPEPGEYAALAGAGLIGFAVWRRRMARKA